MTDDQTIMKILFCTDGSIQAENAVRFGAPLAAAFQAETSVLGIAEKTGQEDAVMAALRRAQDMLKEYHLNPELIAKAGRPVREIVKRSRETHYDLVVIGAVRKDTQGPLWMSGRAYKIIESVASPVLVVIGNRSGLRRILLCTGGTPQANQAVLFAGTIARHVNASVTLFHVLAQPPAIYARLIEQQEDADRVLASDSKLGRTLSHQKKMLDDLGVPGEVHLRHGLVVPELLKELERTEFDLVVSGSSRSGDALRQYVMGDVTREIVNRAELPVLVVRTETGRTKRRLRDVVSRLIDRSKG